MTFVLLFKYRIREEGEKLMSQGVHTLMKQKK